MGSNFAKLEPAGPNRAKQLANRVKQGQTRLSRLKCDLKSVNKGKMGLNWVKWGLN